MTELNGVQKRRPSFSENGQGAELSLAKEVRRGYQLGWSFTALDGKKPQLSNWQKRQRASLKHVLEWVERGCNLGLRTGEASGGLVVIDVDKGGDISELELPKTVTVKTGGGGFHYYFKYDKPLQNSAGKLGKNIDFKADGGQVVYPGSVHPDTWKTYRWMKGRSPDAIDVAELPPHIVTMLSQAKQQERRRPRLDIPDGERNNTLTGLAGTMRAKSMDADSIEAALLVENEKRCQPPLDENEVRAIAQSISRYPSGDEPTAKGDVRLGDEFVAAHADIVRYCPDLEQWFVWDGHRWEPDAVHKAEHLLRELARRRLSESANIASDNKRETEVKFWIRAMDKRKVENGLWMARSYPKVIARINEFDRNPWLLNTLNGTLDLESTNGSNPVVVRNHDSADMISKLCPVEFDPDADQTKWITFLRRVVPDKKVRLFLARAVGYSITGFSTEEVLFHVSGPTASGKSTFVAAVASALGDYAASANFDTFLEQSKNNRGGPRSDLVRLAGKRFVSSIESEEGERLAGGLLKWITGGDKVCVRGLYSSEIEFVPTFTLWLVANFRPRARDDDTALWRRLILLPFEETIPTRDRDPSVKQELSDPDIGGPAVLAWAVKGCASWRCKHLEDRPEPVVTATKQWRAENNPIADWLTERTENRPNETTAFADLKKDYAEWVEETGVRGISQRKLALQLQRRYGEPEHGSNHQAVYVGIRLLR